VKTLHILALLLLAALLNCARADTGGPTTPPPPTGPRPTTVSEILANPAGFGEVVLEGQNVRTTNESDHLWFSDGTGEIVADYQSDNVAPLATPIRIFGSVASDEIDVSRWEFR